MDSTILRASGPQSSSLLSPYLLNKAVFFSFFFGFGFKKKSSGASVHIKFEPTIDRKKKKKLMLASVLREKYSRFIALFIMSLRCGSFYWVF